MMDIVVGKSISSWEHSTMGPITWSRRPPRGPHQRISISRATVKTMRIEELILEGFKSYPVRTQITGWDPSFNAITGLNGSGKSNILDAICFVLGLTNMSQVRFQKQSSFGYNKRLTERVERVLIHQVRAQNQQDLIYKRGQAGVTRASVTVVFNNADKSKSPIGFEQLAQVTVTRQVSSNKYF